MLRQLLTAFYGSAPSDGTATTPEYFLFLSAFQSPLTTADLNQFETLCSAADRQSEDGVGFHCGAPTGGPMSSLCFWIDGNVLGVVEGTAVASARPRHGGGRGGARLGRALTGSIPPRRRAVGPVPAAYDRGMSEEPSGHAPPGAAADRRRIAIIACAG